VLLDADWLGEVRVARIAKDHAEDHRALGSELDAATLGELRRVLTSLRAHLDSEEHLLTRKRLRAESRAACDAGGSRPAGPGAKPARDPRDRRGNGRFR
jgi:hypothetical protein